MVCLCVCVCMCLCTLKQYNVSVSIFESIFKAIFSGSWTQWKSILTNGNVISSILTTSFSVLPPIFTASQCRRWLEPALLLPFLRLSRSIFISPLLLFLSCCCAGVTWCPSGLISGLCHSFSPLRPWSRQQSGHGPQHCLNGCPSCSSRHCFSVNDRLSHSFFGYFLIHSWLCSILRLDMNTLTMAFFFSRSFFEALTEIANVKPK